MVKDWEVYYWTLKKLITKYSHSHYKSWHKFMTRNEIRTRAHTSNHSGSACTVGIYSISVKLTLSYNHTTCLSLMLWLPEVATALAPSSSSSLSSASAAILSVKDRLKSRLLLATAVSDDDSQMSISHVLSAASAAVSQYVTITCKMQLLLLSFCVHFTRLRVPTRMSG